MIKSIVAAIAATGLLLSSGAKAKTFKADPDRTIYITGKIDLGILGVASKLVKLSSENRLPIYMVINSPGGGVLAGLQVISAMKVANRRGVTIKCFVPVLAASMAFQIFANCNERYVLSQSLLLWHPMKISVLGSMDSDELLYQGASMRAMETGMNQKLIEVLQISPALFYYHYRHETMWTAAVLRKVSPNFIKIISDFKNVNNPFDLGDQQ